MDKERLYEENMALKLENNSLKAENMRIKTKFSQVEKELSKKDEYIEEISTNERSPAFKYMRLVSALKQTIKDMKSEAKLNQDELQKLKKNIKSTRLTELEAEIKIYYDECLRLKFSLEDAVKKKGQEISTFTHEDSKHQISVISGLKKEKQDLSSAITSFRDENTRLKQKIVELEKAKKKSGKKDPAGPLKAEIQKLKVLNENNFAEYKENLEQLQREITEYKKNISELKARLDNEERKNREKPVIDAKDLRQNQIENLLNSWKN